MSFKIRTTAKATALTAALAMIVAPAIAENDGGDIGITLPQGFTATVFGDDVGPVRHITVRDDGTVYGALYESKYGALHESKNGVWRDRRSVGSLHRHGLVAQRRNRKRQRYDGNVCQRAHAQLDGKG